MSATIWGKFYWSDWANDPKLKLCSLAAQGLWMRLLCIAAEANPIGYVTVNGNPLDETGIARLVGASVEDVRGMLVELDRNGVFSRDRQGRIYSRRMMNDEKKRAIAKKNGKNGGNPTLGNKRQIPPSDNPKDKGVDKAGDNTQSPDTRIQDKKESSLRSPKNARGSRLPTDWEIPNEWGRWAVEEFGVGSGAVRTEAAKFRDYWCAKTGTQATKLDWQATWRNWCRTAFAPKSGPPRNSNRPMTAAELSTDLLNQMRQADESNAQADRDQPPVDQYALPRPR